MKEFSHRVAIAVACGALFVAASDSGRQHRGVALKTPAPDATALTSSARPLDIDSAYPVRSVDYASVPSPSLAN
jgi:hypothetical protein